ncbi:MAG: thioredoxin domain-containing protein [Candidatus Pacebacteria bacterium]|nr:thioredoxin domain-containing protein [Candidatus Paceibacterota bacterium]
MNKQYIFAVVLIGALVALIGWARANKEPVTSIYDSFTQCVADSGATFYGAFWCPHCISQKKEVESAAQYYPYVECSTPDRQGQMKVCADAGITSYPTWEFADGTRESGHIPLETLSEKTGCSLPTAG